QAIDSLGKHLRERVHQGLLPYVHWSFGTDFEAVPVATRVLDRVETQTLLGELLARMGGEFAPPAREHLMGAWNADSTRLLPAALLGELADQQGDPAQATRWFDRVHRSTTGEPRALALAGTALVQRSLRSGLDWHVSEPDPDALRARSLLA